MKKNTIILIGLLLVFGLAFVAVKSCKKEPVNNFEKAKNQEYEKIDKSVNSMSDSAVNTEYRDVLQRRR